MSSKHSVPFAFGLHHCCWGKSWKANALDFLKLSKQLEVPCLQEVVSSGLGFILIRAGKSGAQDAEFESSANVALGPQGSSPQQSKITRGQVSAFSSPAMQVSLQV